MYFAGAHTCSSSTLGEMKQLSHPLSLAAFRNRLRNPPAHLCGCPALVNLVRPQSLHVQKTSNKAE